MKTREKVSDHSSSVDVQNHAFRWSELPSIIDISLPDSILVSDATLITGF